MLNDFDNILESIKKEDWFKDYSKKDDFQDRLMEWIKENVLPEFLSSLSKQVEEIIEINPEYSEPEILVMTTKYMVDFLGAQSASVRIYDPFTEQMLSYGLSAKKWIRGGRQGDPEESIIGSEMACRAPLLPLKE